MKERLIKEVKKAVIILILGSVYYLWVTVTGIGIPCIFNKVTGLLCPGCGITRMILALVKFDFVTAYSYNKLIFLTWPMLAIPLIYSTYRYIRYNDRKIGKLNYMLVVEAVLIIAFGIIRNIK